MSERGTNLPPEQQAIWDKCFHPSGHFVEFPPQDVETSIPARFEKIVRLYPDRIAVKTVNQIATYAELNTLANRIARTLILADQPATVPIALLVSQPLDLVTTILGVLKAGQFFALLDPSFPKARLATILQTTQAQLLVADNQNAVLAQELANSGARLLRLESIGKEVSSDNLSLCIAPQSFAYIAYTSGSTGQPKGVIQDHRHILHDTKLRTDAYHLCDLDKLSLLASSTSVAVKTAFFALLNGASLLPFEVREEGITHLADWLIQKEISICRISAPLFRRLLETIEDDKQFLDMRVIQFAGGMRYKSDVDLWKKHFTSTSILANSFSSTETGFLCSYLMDFGTEITTNEIPIGYPSSQKQVLLLDEGGNPVADGQIGEIVVRSHFLSPGYWRNPDLTEAKFKSASDGEGAVLFFTGDLGVMLPGGCLMYKGRKDNRIKIRGYTVETSEIEVALREHTNVKEIEVIAWDQAFGEKYIAAYIVPKSHLVLKSDDMRRFLKQRLPDYMVPSAFVFLESLPLTNGKLDRNRLPRPNRSRPELTETYVAPRNNVERELCETWSDALIIDLIGIHDNFFDLGGHSLTAMKLVAQVSKRFQLRMSLQCLFKSPTVAGMAATIANLRSESSTEGALQSLHNSEDLGDGVISRRNTTAPYPLSFGQERLWILNQLEPESPIYNEAKLIRLRGFLDVSALEKSFNSIIARHEVLRTTIVSIDGRPAQRVAVGMTIELPVIDLRDIKGRDPEAEAQRLIDETIRRPFDLSQDLMVRARVLRLEDRKYIFILVTHHIASDAWSSGVFWRELGVLYGAFASGRATDLKELPIQYKDYAAWQRESLRGEKLQKHLSYWKKKLDGIPGVLNFLNNRSRPDVLTHRGARQAISLSKDLSEKLRGLSRRQGVTLYMTLLAAFQLLLYRYTGQEDIVVGSPIANRTQSEVQDLIGFFINTLVLRTEFVGNPSFLELLHQVRQTALEAYDHQDLPFEKLVEELRPERTLNYSPLFQVMFNMSETGDFQIDLPELMTERISFYEVDSKFDFTLYAREQNDVINVSLVHRVDLFTESWSKQFLEQYSHLLTQLVGDPEQCVNSYSLVTPQSRVSLPDPTTAIAEPMHRAITDTFLSLAQQQPKHQAIRQGKRTWTYSELAACSSTIGRALKAAGLERGDVVAVHGRRSFGLIASMMGTFLSGGVLLLIDCDLPNQRKQLMLKEGRARKIIFVGDRREDTYVTGDLSVDVLSVEPMTGLPVDLKGSLDLEKISLPELAPNDPCYIFFTSGTTSIPKAVLGSHKALSHFLAWQRETFAIGLDDRVAQLTNLSFDVVLRDVFLPLTSGAILCLPDFNDETATDDRMIWMQREEISVLHAVPSLTEAWLASTVKPSLLPSLRWVFFAGEPLTDTLVRQWQAVLDKDAAIINLYGPTETTLAKCYFRVPADPDEGVQPVGIPITSAQSLVLTHGNRLCGINEPGEIVLRTPFRSLGYLNAPEESQKRFIKNSFREDPDDVIYFTGDRGRYRPDGSLEILGRLDDQVKLRGVRVEPAGVAAILSQNPMVASCFVVGRQSERGETCLVAYVVASAQNLPTSSQLRSYLLDRLPTPMVPSTFVFLDVLPLMPNGKVDRNALPEPAYQRREAEDGFVAPRSELEKVVASIWAEVLKIERIGVHDNFFDAGGHSLLAIRVLSRVTQAFQLTVPLKVFFESPTVAEMAKVIEQNQAQTAMPGDLERLVTDLENMSEKDAQQVLAEERMER